MHVYFRATNIQTGEFLTFSSLNQRRTRNHHIGLLSHVDTVTDDGHIAPTNNTISEYPSHLRNAGSRQDGILLKNVSRASPAREGPGLLGEEEA